MVAGQGVTGVTGASYARSTVAGEDAQQGYYLHAGEKTFDSGARPHGLKPAKKVGTVALSCQATPGRGEGKLCETEN